MNRSSVARLVGIALLATGTAASFGMPAMAAPAPAAAGVTSVDSQVLNAMQRDLHLTADQAMARLATESHAAATEQTLRQQLGSAFGGAYIEGTSLVVGVTNAAQAATVTANGATPKVVRYSEAQLTAAKNKLDKAKAPTNVSGWYVDETTNSVVVETTSAATAATNAFVAKASGVTVRTVHGAANHPLYNVRGGDAWYGSNFRCSVGFSAKSSSGGKYMITAGHCTAGGGPAYGYNNVSMGTLSASTFGSAGDFGRVTVSSASWTLVGTVNHYGGSDVHVSGHTEAATGASICRSGSTTGWHCGTIQAKNQTVSYTGGPTVTGLTKTNVCAEPGDSGGSWMSGTQAQGVTSGGSGNCSSGGTTYFQPVNEALSAYGLTLVTS
jgi:streptogrisin C